jgi:hypothetical protein
MVGRGTRHERVARWRRPTLVWGRLGATGAAAVATVRTLFRDQSRCRGRPHARRPSGPGEHELARRRRAVLERRSRRTRHRGFTTGPRSGGGRRAGRAVCATHTRWAPSPSDVRRRRGTRTRSRAKAPPEALHLAVSDGRRRVCARRPYRRLHGRAPTTGSAPDGQPTGADARCPRRPSALPLCLAEPPPTALHRSSDRGAVLSPSNRSSRITDGCSAAC